MPKKRAPKSGRPPEKLDSASSIGITEGAGGTMLENSRHEKFAQAVANGDSGVVAYQNAFGCTRDAAEASATRMRDNVGILDRINFLKAAQSQKAEMTRDELRRALVGIFCAKPSEAGYDNPLCELVMTKMGPAVVFPSKMAAAAQLAKLCGWDAPSKVEHSGTITHAVLTKERQEALAAKKRAAIIRRGEKQPTGAN